MNYFALASPITLFLAAAPAWISADEVPSAAGGVFEDDRKAILSMAGRYRVTFDFAETVPLQPGYTRAAPQHSGGTELVLVVEDTGRLIQLQHILVLGGDKKVVVKHWRQRWEYEPAELLEFRGHRSFAHRRLSPNETRGAWGQAVFEVDDAPRYQGIGRWRHEGGVSSWESNETWRPLPRREYTKRSDYDVVACRNRHTLMPAGWVHEQDNLKLRVTEGGIEAVAREAGLNRYERQEGEELAAGTAYWRTTEAFWRRVREAWDSALVPATVVVDDRDPAGKPRYERLLAIADRIAEGVPVDPSEAQRAVAEAVRGSVHAQASVTDGGPDEDGTRRAGR